MARVTSAVSIERPEILAQKVGEVEGVNADQEMTYSRGQKPGRDM